MKAKPRKSKVDEQKLLARRHALRALINDYVKSNETFVTYGYLRDGLNMEQLELNRLLGQLANEDIKNGEPTVDSLVTNKTEFVPPEGFFKASITGRKHLKTKEQKIQYQADMIQQFNKKFGIQIYQGKQKVTLPDGSTKKMISKNLFDEQNKAFKS